MNPDWLKHPEQEHWSADIGLYTAAVGRTMFGSYCYTVADKTRALAAGDKATLEEAQAAAERRAGELR